MAALRRFFVCLAFLLHAATAKAADPTVGFWSGWIEKAGSRHALSLKIEQREGALAGAVDCPSMGYFRVDLLGVGANGEQVKLSIPLPVGALKLSGARRGDSIAGRVEKIDLVNGEWKSVGTDGAFELRRASEPAPPYAIEDVSIKSGDIVISGSLFMPRHGTNHPGIVYIAGSGDTTRGDGSFLADSLARGGIAALVYDKRGAGRSGGDWKSGGYEELAVDASRVLEALQAHANIDVRATGFVCQSEGCWVAPIAMRQGARAAFLAAQSGPAVSVADEDLDHYRVALRSAGFGEAEIAEAFDLVAVDQRISLGTAGWSELAAKIEKYRDRAWFKHLGYEPLPADDPLRRFAGRTLGYDPLANLQALRVRSLWIYGDADTIIPVADSLKRINALRSPKPEILILKNAGHSFTIDSGPLPRLAPGYPDAVSRWITRPPR